jgi:hypothetical protein
MERTDEEAFNAIFNSFPTVAPRTLDSMRHVWHEGPGGPVLSWVIEARQSDHDWQLVGHHGLCPIRYTLGGTDLVLAKTVNTFLLPEYRGKFVYPRFELRCLAEAEQMIDASFSVAPKAERLRAALGYQTDIRMLHLECGLQSPRFVSRVLPRLARRYPRVLLPALARLWNAIPVPKAPFALDVLDSDRARTAPFFDDFWEQARPLAGLAPRRDKADLDWRFWRDGGEQRTTLTYCWQNGARAYCIVRHGNPFIFELQDIFLTTVNAALLQQFLNAIFSWCAERGALMLTFWTSEDGQPPELLDVFRRNMAASLSRRFRDNRMSRRLTARGRGRIGADWPPFNFTVIATPA